jgi:hypothetical protein
VLAWLGAQRLPVDIDPDQAGVDREALTLGHASRKA